MIFQNEADSKIIIDYDKKAIQKFRDGIANLNGSEKQFSWAKSIQRKLFNEIDLDCGYKDKIVIADFIEELHMQNQQKDRLNWYLAFVHIITEKNAQWWINNRENPIEAYLHEKNQNYVKLV